MVGDLLSAMCCQEISAQESSQAEELAPSTLGSGVLTVLFILYCVSVQSKAGTGFCWDLCAGAVAKQLCRGDGSSGVN